MRLRYEFTTPVARCDEDDYVRHLVISVECYNEECTQGYLVGKLAMDQILWDAALDDEVSLFDICDNDSQGLHEAYAILTKDNRTFRPSLGIREITSHVMFLYGAVFHPAIHAYRQGILHTAFNLFGEDSLALMWLDTSGLTESELADLGFRKIAGETLIYRQNPLRTPFGDRHPRGHEGDIDALPEHEEWVIKEWEQFKDVAED